MRLLDICRKHKRCVIPDEATTIKVSMRFVAKNHSFLVYSVVLVVDEKSVIQQSQER